MTCVLSKKVLIFAPECWKCMSQRPRFETFSWGKCCQTPPETCEFFPSLPTPKLLVPCLELIENPALCYRKESPRAVMKGWKQFYH